MNHQSNSHLPHRPHNTFRCTQANSHKKCSLAHSRRRRHQRPAALCIWITLKIVVGCNSMSYKQLRSFTHHHTSAWRYQLKYVADTSSCTGVVYYDNIIHRLKRFFLNSLGWTSVNVSTLNHDSICLLKDTTNHNLLLASRRSVGSLFMIKYVALVCIPLDYPRSQSIALQDALGSVGNPPTLPYVKVQSPKQAVGRRAAEPQNLLDGLQAGLQGTEAALLDQDGPQVWTIHNLPVTIGVT